MNFFEKALKDVDNLEQELLGPDYKYFKQINTPSEIGMSSEGSISALTYDIVGLVNYVKLLAEGGGSASKVDGPLGNKFFLRTGAKCKDKQTGEHVTRSIYVNNVPDGSIPFITSGLGGVYFTEMEGLVPGTLSNMSNLNPMKLFQAFMIGTYPECQALEMETIDVNNIVGVETAYVTTNDITSMSPCWFADQINPITGKRCIEAFGNLNKNENISKMPDNIIIKIYYSALGLLGLYILMKLFERKK